MANEIQVKVTAGPAGNLIGQIKAATDAAKAAAGDVPIKLSVDTAGTAAQVASAVADAKQAASVAGATELKFHATVDQGLFSSELKRVFAAGDLQANNAGRSWGAVLTQGFGQSIQDMGNLIKGMFQLFTPGGNTGFAAFGSGASAAGIALVIPIIGGVVSAVEALTGVLPIAAAGVVGLGAAFATVKIGLNDVLPAIQAYYTAQDATRGKDAQIAAQQLSTANSIISANQAVVSARQALTDAYRTSADSMISANEAVANAEQSLGDAQRSAVNSMISAREGLASAIQSEANAERNAADSLRSALETQARAEDSVTTAQQAELRAQLNLTDAKTAAQRTIEDLNNKVIDDAISQRQATEDLENAQIALNKARSGQGGDPEAAQTALDAAIQRVNEVGLAYQRSQQDAATANAAGVSGAKNVVSAQDSLVAAQNQVKDSTQALADADTKLSELQITNAQSVADAKQKVTDSQRNLTDTEISTNEQIVNAQQKVGDSQRALTNTQITSVEQVVHAQQAVDAAVRAQAQAYAQAKASAESAAGSLSMYNALLADLAPNAQDAVRAVTGLRGVWEDLQHTVQQHLFAGVGDEIRQIGAVFLPVLKTGLSSMADALNKVIVAFGAWLTSKDTVRDFGTIMANVSDAVAKLAPAVGPVMQIITDLLTVASSFLPGMADGFAKSAQSTADWVRHLRDTGQLKDWMQQGLNVLRDLWNIGKDLLKIFDDLSGHKGPSSSFMDDIATLVHDFRLLFDVVGTGLQWLYKFSDWTYKVSQDLKPGLIQDLKDLWHWIGDLPMPPDMSHSFDSIKTGVGNAWDGLTRSGFWHFLTTPPPRPDFGHILDGVGGALSGVWDSITRSGFWRFLTTPPPRPDFAGFFHGLWDDFKTIYNWIADAWNSLHFTMPSIDIFGWHTPSFWVGVNQLPHWQAVGGPGGGLTWVGEQGPELVNLPSGSQVLPHSNSMVTAAGVSGSGTTHVQLEFVGSPGDPLLEWLRNSIRIRGGNVQKALGHS